MKSVQKTLVMAVAAALSIGTVGSAMADGFSHTLKISGAFKNAGCDYEVVGGEKDWSFGNLDIAGKKHGSTLSADNQTHTISLKGCTGKIDMKVAVAKMGPMGQIDLLKKGSAEAIAGAVLQLSYTYNNGVKTLIQKNSDISFAAAAEQVEGRQVKLEGAIIKEENNIITPGAFEATVPVQFTYS